MRQLIVRSLLGLILCMGVAFAQSRVDHIVGKIRAGDYEDARQSLKSLLYTPGKDQEAALYLLIRIELAEENGREALETADRLLGMYPNTSFGPYVHFARAEAHFLNMNYDAARQELDWVTRNATDTRLVSNAKAALEKMTAGGEIESTEPDSYAEFEPPPASGEYRLKEGHVALLLSFPDPEDAAAADLQRGFRFAADYGDMPFPATIVRVGSPYEAASAARDLMNDDELLLLLFAGDEGSAMSVALLSREYGVPVLKLNTGAYSFTEFSPMLYEFLPSMRTQTLALGEYATNEAGNQFALVLTADDIDGRACREGFTEGVTKYGGSIDALETYPPTATSVRHELATVFSSEPRLARGETPLKALLSKEEREELFGDEEAGEVLEAGYRTALFDSTYEDTITTSESFFFQLSAGNIDNFSSQLSIIPERTTLFGNSSWIDVGALERQAAVTNGMYIAAPLLPTVDDTIAYVERYATATSAAPGPWELLGIDAGEFAGKLMDGEPGSRSALRRRLENSPRFEGLSVTVDFRDRRENQFARILRHSRGDLRTVR